MAHLGDFDASAVLYGKFTTYRPSTGAPFTLAGTPALSVYKDNSTTQSTTGVTLTVDFDSVTGLHHFAIDTSADGTFYSAGSLFDIVITTGTVDSVSVAGSVVASFTIRKNSALKPATAGRTLVVDASGLADANTVKVGPTGSGTAQTARDIGASVLLSSGTGTGQLDFTSGVVKANITQLLGTAWLTPGTAGTPDVNVKLWNGLATVALPLVPTTAGRTLDVSAGGEAGIDWANVGSPTTSLALTGTTIATTQKVDVETIKTNPVVNAGTVTFPTTATLASTTNITAGTVTTATNVTTVNGLAAGVITAASIAADAITDAKVASDVTIASVTGAVGSVTGNVGGNVTGSVGSVATGGISAASFAAGAIDAAAIAANAIGASELAADAVAEIADAVWDELLSGHTVSGSTGEALTASGGAGDPWITALPGSYSAGQAGHTLGTFLDATVSSRASQTSLNTLDDYVDTEVAAIKAKTDLIPAAPAAVGDIPTAVQNADALLDRDMSAVSDTNARSPLNALRFIRNKWDVAGSTLTVKKEDDSTTAWTAAVSTSAGADPIVGNDPA